MAGRVLPRINPFGSVAVGSLRCGGLTPAGGRFCRHPGAKPGAAVPAGESEARPSAVPPGGRQAAALGSGVLEGYGKAEPRAAPSTSTVGLVEASEHQLDVAIDQTGSPIEHIQRHELAVGVCDHLDVAASVLSGIGDEVAQDG